MASDITPSEVSGLLDRLSTADQRALAERQVSVTGLRRLNTAPAGPGFVHSVLLSRTPGLGLPGATDEDRARAGAAETAVQAVDRANAGLPEPLLLPLPEETRPQLTANAKEVLAELEALTGSQRTALLKAGISASKLAPVCELPGGAELVLGALNCHCRPAERIATEEDQQAEARVRLVIPAVARLAELTSFTFTAAAHPAPVAARAGAQAAAPAAAPAAASAAAGKQAAPRPSRAGRAAAAKEAWQERMRDPRAVSRSWLLLVLLGLGATVAGLLTAVLSNGLLVIVPAVATLLLSAAFLLQAVRRPPTTPWRTGLSTLLCVSGALAVGAACVFGGSLYLGLFGKQFTASSAHVAYTYSYKYGAEWTCSVALPDGHTAKLSSCTSVMKSEAGVSPKGPVPVSYPMVYDPRNLTPAHSGTTSSLNTGTGLALLLAGLVALLGLSAAGARGSVRRLRDGGRL